ncbi:MAG: hypothetical protein ACRC46_06950 [Thermoguttaceae bacterium]
MKTILSFLIATLFASTLFAAETPRLAVVPGGNAVELCDLVEAKLFDNKGLELVERNEIDVVLAERKLSGLFDTANAIELGGILKADLFAALEPNSLVVFDAKTGLRFVDETLPEKSVEETAQTAAKAVGTALEKRRKFAEHKLVMFGILSIRNAEFSRDRDTWCKALVRLLERELMTRDCAVLERSRLGHVIEERRLNGDNANDLLAAMKLLDIEFSRGAEPNTFKITARIGDEVFRAESPIDSPLDAVVAIADRLAGTQSSANQADRHNEAKRFFDEANFLAGLSNYEPALERLDAAVALDYASIRYRNKQALLLILHATYQMNPEFIRVMPSAPDGYPPVEQESFEAALVLVRRAVDIIESIPGSFLGESVDEEVLRELSRINRILAGMIWTFVDFGSQSPKSLFPTQYENVNRLLDDILVVWEKTYDEVVATVNDAASFAKYCELIRYREQFAPLQQTPKTAQLYEKLIGDLIRFTERWQDVPEAAAVRNELCRDFAYFAADFKIAREYLLARNDGTTRTRQIEESIARVCRSLDSAPLAEFGTYSYLAQNGFEFSPDQDAPSRKDRSKQELLKQRIASLPPNQNVNDMVMLFDEAVACCFFETDDYVASVEHFFDFVELANERSVPASHLAISLLDRLEACHVFYAKDKPEKLIDLRNNLERYFKAVERQVELAASHRLAYAPECVENKLNNSRSLWNPPATERLWKEEVPIWTSNDIHYHVNHICLYDNTLFMFVFEWNNEFWNVRIDEFDCKNRIYKKGNTPLFKRARAYLGNELPDINIARDSSCVDARNIFYGTHGEGIFVIPRDGSAPWRLTQESGLPSNHVQTLAVMNGTLYVGLGRDNQESWLVSVDTETRKANILASSASIDNHPFSNCSPAPMYAHFEPDTKRNRLLMLIKKPFVGNPDGGFGLWTLDVGSTNVVTQRFPFYFHDVVPGHILPNGDQFLIQDSIATLLVDLDQLDKGLESIRVVGVSANYDSYRSMYSPQVSQQTGQAFGMKWGTIRNGEFWGGVTFNDKTLRKRYGDNPYFMRASLESKDDFEFLTTPTKEPGPGWSNIQFCRVVNDGKDLLFGQHHEGIFLLRFE